MLCVCKVILRPPRLFARVYAMNWPSVLRVYKCESISAYGADSQKLAFTPSQSYSICGVNYALRTQKKTHLERFLIGPNAHTVERVRDLGRVATCRPDRVRVCVCGRGCVHVCERAEPPIIVGARVAVAPLT